MCHSAGRAVQKTETRKGDSESVAENTHRQKQGNTSSQGTAGQGRRVPSAAAEQSEQNNRDEEQQVSVSAVSVTIDLNAQSSQCGEQEQVKNNTTRNEGRQASTF